MGQSTVSGPWRAGTIQLTTGTTVGTDIANVGYVVMAQSYAFPEQAAATAIATTIVIPALSQVLDISGICTTAFADGGTNETMSIGFNTGGTDLCTDCFRNDADLEVDDVFSLMGRGFDPTNSLTLPVIAATATALMKNVGTTDNQLYALNTSAGTPVANEGEVVLTATYLQAINLT